MTVALAKSSLHPQPRSPRGQAARKESTQLRTYPQSLRSNPELSGEPDAEVGRPALRAQTLSGPWAEALQAHPGGPRSNPCPPGSLCTWGHTACPHPHACGGCCQAGSRCPQRPRPPPPASPAARGWSKGGEFGKLVNSKKLGCLCSLHPLPPLPGGPSLRLAAGDKGQATSKGAAPR